MLSNILDLEYIYYFENKYDKVNMHLKIGHKYYLHQEE